MASDTIVDLDYSAFVMKIKRVAGVDLNGYKPEQMRRRLLSLAGRHGSSSLSAFADLMEKEPKALSAFKDFFTINVSEFLRDPARWDDLTQKVLPEILQATGRRALKVWSAGCSYGAEPYSLAMVLEEMAPGKPHVIYATDIDERILERARRGAGYQEQDLRNVDAARRSRFFTRQPDGSFEAKDTLKARIRFMRQDLLSQVPDRELDLIVCRNVVIYFTEEAKRSLYTRMYGALSRHGVLFVGGTEIVVGGRELGLEPFFTSFYRKHEARLAGVA